ncbi:MAG TPA: TspO/MBR family protein [Puia sp.]|nr:TspO/MBR family protein [Puia sp.]
MKLLFSLIITLSIGAIAGYATASNIDTWYVHLQKPSYNPPNYIFAPVWTVLYILMGISLYLVWKQPALADRRRALMFFFIQLFLNFCWSFIFFYFHQIAFAMVDIVLLWVAILITILLFSSFNKTASWLLVPYISWVSFATVLNIAIYKLNA